MTGVMSEEFVQLACDVLHQGNPDVLKSLEWDPRPDSTIAPWLHATLALGRAQGRTLAVTPALGIALAHILHTALSPVEMNVSAVLDARVVDDRIELVGPAGTELAERVLVDAPGIGLGLIEAPLLSPLESGPGPFDPLVAVTRVAPSSSLHLIAGLEPSDGRQAAATNLARLFISAEILGACEHLMAGAVRYAHDRMQFGQPIGTFQAVQHMLASAEVQVRALSSGVEMLVPRIAQLCDPDTSHHLALLKALAGRAGHHVSQATLQVLGGIGFTEEHEHHRYAKRILTLDALCGSGDQLAREIGQAARLGEIRFVAVP